MTRTTRSVRGPSELQDRVPVAPEPEEGGDPAASALQTSTAPLYFQELVRPAGPALVEAARPSDTRSDSITEIEGERRDRLHAMLDRAADPVPPSAEEVLDRGGAARRGRVWRNQPHVLGRLAAVVLVLVLAGACVLVAFRVMA